MFTTRLTDPLWGASMGKLVAQESRSLDPLDVRQGYPAPIEAMAAQLWRPLDATKEQLEAAKEAAKKAAIDAARAEARTRVREKVATAESGQAPSAGGALDVTSYVLVAALVAAIVLIGKKL